MVHAYIDPKSSRYLVPVSSVRRGGVNVYFAWVCLLERVTSTKFSCFYYQPDPLAWSVVDMNGYSVIAHLRYTVLCGRSYG